MHEQARRQEPHSVSGAGEGGDPAIYAPEGLTEGISILAAEPVFAGILERAGPPRFRRRRNGFGTLLHIILEQQVSIDAAAAMYRRLLGVCCPMMPETFLALDDATLRSCGFSRQKMGYARDLAEMVDNGKFDFVRLGAAEDEAALAELLADQRNRAVERRNLSALRARPSRCLAGRRSGSAGRDRRSSGLRLASGRGRDAPARRGVAALALGRRVSFLAVLPPHPRPDGAPPAARALCLRIRIESA